MICFGGGSEHFCPLWLTLLFCSRILSLIRLNFVDALHDVILAPQGSNGRLSLTQCKAAWMTMISAMHVKIFQSNRTLASLSENEMFWKHHWAWHSGGSDKGNGDRGNGQSTIAERRFQGQLDRLMNWKKQQGGGGGGKKTGGRRGQGGGNRGQGGGNGDGHKRFNNNVPPPPNNGGGGGGKDAGKSKSAGQKAWNKRQKTGRGGGK